MREISDFYLYMDCIMCIPDCNLLLPLLHTEKADWKRNKKRRACFLLSLVKLAPFCLPPSFTTIRMATWPTAHSVFLCGRLRICLYNSLQQEGGGQATPSTAKSRIERISRIYLVQNAHTLPPTHAADFFSSLTVRKSHTRPHMTPPPPGTGP